MIRSLYVPRLPSAIRTTRLCPGTSGGRPAYSAAGMLDGYFIKIVNVYVQQIKTTYVYTTYTHLQHKIACARTFCDRRRGERTHLFLDSLCDRSPCTEDCIEINPKAGGALGKTPSPSLTLCTRNLDGPNRRVRCPLSHIVIIAVIISSNSSGGISIAESSLSSVRSVRCHARARALTHARVACAWARPPLPSRRGK